MQIEKIAEAADPNLTLVFLVDTDQSETLVRSSTGVFPGCTVWVARCPSASQLEMEKEASALLAELDRTGFKRASLIAFGRAAAIAQIVLAQNSQIVRRAVVVDPLARDEAGFFRRLGERLQARWPLPLPFRLERERFDIRYLQHRVACPLLVIQTSAADELAKECCGSLAGRAPSSWLLKLQSIESTGSPRVLDSAFFGVVREFIEVPAKRSQKNLGAAKKEAPVEVRERKVA